MPAARRFVRDTGLVFGRTAMFSTFWVPTRFMPGWNETVATWNPFTPTLDAARSIMLGHTDWGDLGIGLSLLVALAVVTYGLAGRHYVAATNAD
jgi:ABC-type uncharacterized transport system permease subunit